MHRTPLPFLLKWIVLAPALPAGIGGITLGGVGEGQFDGSCAFTLFVALWVGGPIPVLSMAILLDLSGTE